MEDHTALADETAILVAEVRRLRAELTSERERYKAGLRRADEHVNAMSEELKRYAAGKEQPVLWSVYNEMHLRAANAETVIARVRGWADGLDTYAQTVLQDDSAVHPVAATVRQLLDAVPADGPSRVADEAQQPETQTLPPSEGPEYTLCACGHIDPEHSTALFRHCLECGCLRYRPVPAAVSQPGKEA